MKNNNSFVLNCSQISKSYNSNSNILNNIDLSISNNSIIGVSGANGSGKTTLLKIIAGLIKPSNGKVELIINNKIINSSLFHCYIGFVAPYINLYEEFSSSEHIKLIAKMQNIKIGENTITSLLDKFNLLNYKTSYLSSFSSGMKQKFRFLLALINHPDIIILDEPFTNLDPSGIEIFNSVIKDLHNKGKGIIIASNSIEELAFANSMIKL